MHLRAGIADSARGRGRHWPLLALLLFAGCTTSVEVIRWPTPAGAAPRTLSAEAAIENHNQIFANPWERERQIESTAIDVTAANLAQQAGHLSGTGVAP